ncbi:MAG: Ig domain-containing protein, partial [Paludibacteraceae bacterium]|nr:Ig domain-containing protein [Paludibacteraceae bacterium]
MLGLMATTIQAQSPTPIANLDFEITSSTTTMPANYVYSTSNTPNLKTQNGIKCIIISDGGGSTAPTFNGSSAPTNGKRWMAFCPDVDCEVTIGIMSNKKKFFIQSKDGEFFSHTNTANAVEEKTVTGLKAGQWYAMCGGSSQVYITKMAFKVSAPAGPVAVTGVTLNKTSASVEAGQTLQLTATVAPTNADNKNVSWTSNNPTVANVDQNGLVTAYSAGNATITVTTEDGSKTATCTVTVTEPAAPVAVTGVSLNKSTTSIYVGASETLTATVAPADATNKAVTWSSNNTSVASVNNGVVTGVAIGQATITAKTVDGNFTATCAVTVETAPIINVTGVTLNKTSLELQVGKNETLTATVAPSNAANKNVTWSSSNSGVASVSNGLVTAIAAGTATITVTTEDGNKTATCSVTVTSGPPVPVSGLTTHVPEIYNARSKDGGYATPLVTYDNREYELYYASRTASSVASLPTTAGDKKDGIEDPATATSNYLKTFDGWCEAKMNSISGGTSAKASKSGEFSELYDEWRMSGNGIKIDIDGFDQFSYYAADKSTEIDSKTGTFKKEQRFQVFIDGVMEPETQCNTSATVRRYDISSGHHVIEVKGMSGGDSKFYGFSLRVAQVPRTKYLKGNDSTQVIMQTTAPKPVYYYTKYNNMGETKLIWD